MPEVARAVSALSTQQRAVVFLTYWDDLDVEAVAELLGVTAGTVRKQLARARAHLREVLG
ncbi:MAG: RNA polymerase sigma factor [Acidimicrobiia bacterium]